MDERPHWHLQFEKLFDGMSARCPRCSRDQNLRVSHIGSYKAVRISVSILRSRPSAIFVASGLSYADRRYPVIREVDLGLAFIDQDCHRRVRRGVRNMLRHLLHDQGISYQQAHRLWRPLASVLVDETAIIEFSKLHQASGAERRFHDRFDLLKRVGAPYRFPKFVHIRMSNSIRMAARTLSNGLSETNESRSTLRC